MFSYILQVTLCWSAFYLLYLALLRKETFFHINRWYLLGTLVIGLFIPLIQWQPSPVIEDHRTYTIAIEPIQLQIDQLEQSIEAASQSPLLNWTDICLAIYLSGVLFFIALLLHGLWKIWKLYRAGEVAQQGKIKVVYTKETHLPFSFFNYLFWSKHFEAEHREKAQILRHEEAHIHQWHTLDVLFLELLNIVFWCSPIIYFYRKSLRTTHEYLADALVLQDSKRKEYGHLLLKQSLSGIQIALANHFIHSQLKNRILMMTRNKSRKRNLMKYLPFLPILLLAILVFSKHDGRAQVEKAVASLMQEQESNHENIEKRLIELAEIYKELGCCENNPNPPYYSFGNEYSIFIHSYPENSDKIVVAELTKTLFPNEGINVSYALNDRGELTEIGFSDGPALNHGSSKVGWSMYFDNDRSDFENTLTRILEMYLKNYEEASSQSAKDRALTAFQKEQKKWLELYPNETEKINHIVESVKSKSNIGSILDGEVSVIFNQFYIKLYNAKNGEEQIDALQTFTDFLDDLYDKHPENPLKLINTFSKEGYKILKKDQLPIEYRIDDRDRIIVYLMAGQSHLNLHKGGDRKFLKVYESDFVITHILDSSPNDKDRTSDFNFSGDSPNGTNWSNYKVSNTRKTITHGTDDELFEEFTDGVDKRLIYTNGRVESRFASSFREEKVKTSFIHPIKDPSKISKETGYGMRMHPIFKKEQLHTGVDYVVPMNTEIVATADGKVVAVKNWQKGYGLHLTVEHQNGYATFYAHLEKALVKVGQSVKQGEVIALSGNTGTSTGPHLHYEVRKDGKAIDFEQEEISRASIYQDIEEEKYSSGSDLLKTQLEIMMMGDFEKRYLQYGSFSSLKLDEDEFNTHINPNFNISLSGEILEQNNGADGLAQFASNHQQTDLEKGYTDFYIDGKQHRFYIYSQQKVASDFAAAFSSPSLSLSERSQMLSKDYQFYTKTFPSNEDDIKNMLFEEISQRGFEFKILKNRTVILLNDEKENLFSTYSEETINALAEFAEYVTKYDLKVIEGNFEAVFHAPNLNLGERSQMLSEDYRLFSSKHSDKKSEIEATLRKVVSARDLRVEISDDRKVILYNDKEKEKENLEIVVTALGNKRVNEPKVLPMTDEIKIPEVDELPRFPSKECEALEITEAKRNCSNQALLKYIYTNIKYPAAARKAGIEGMNVVQFKVMLDGSLEDIRLLRDIGGGCGEEAQRVIEKMNTDNIRWIPGKKDGKNVAVEFTIPVKFKLQGDSKKEGLQEEEIFKVVEEMPRLFSEECEAMATDEEKRKCSQDALLEYLYTNLRYPKAAKDAGVEGMCVVQFTVEKDGSVSDVAVVRDVGVGLGDESARVVEKMNEDSIRWIPGEQRGRTVRVRFTLPIKFDLGALKTAPEKFDPTPKRASQKLQLTNFNIAPNPSNGELRLRFVGVAKPLAIKVYDANGKVIFEEQVQNFDGNFNEQIEVQGSAGVHFLTIEQEGRLFVEQIMIE